MKTQTETQPSATARPDFSLVKAAMYKTAYATVSCAYFKAGDCVSVSNPWLGDNGVIWFDVTKLERGECPTTSYPHHHLKDFCL